MKGDFERDPLVLGRRCTLPASFLCGSMTALRCSLPQHGSIPSGLHSPHRRIVARVPNGFGPSARGARHTDPNGLGAPLDEVGGVELGAQGGAPRQLQRGGNRDRTDAIWCRLQPSLLG